ncbi:uncharacterized protein LOC132756324 isoform X2 [Ruditapes philippinarum]|uniref:uncharacterized protein LOC132756324 isoform X2 n=1 Tax=Ruditapes philippinarum TaxID=129788 RepID=UPI00295C353D|nr:uncharacterized protein LOC132756324 isoform X2 [Ruditapes philippinarum]
MEGSRHQTWLTENIDHSESKGSSERVQDQNTEGSNCDTSNEDNSKHTPKFKSPTYNADDSGFVDLCPSQEVDDDVWPTRRESFLQSSTPNRRTLPDQHSSRFEITQSSPIQVRSFQVPPLALRSYFIAQCDTPKWNVDQPRSISNTVLNNVVSNQYTGINYQDYHSNRLLSEYAKLISLTSTGNEQSHVSELTRGHSTIASLLNSRPLHLVNIAQRNPEHNFINDIAEARKIVESVTNDSSADTSTFCKIGEESCKTATITSHYTTPIIRDTVESQNTIAYTCEVDSECLDDKQKFTLNSMSNEYDDDSLGIDKNNNLQLVQKYSDISDACVSDTETSVEASSSEEDPPKAKQDIINVSNKSKRKARYPRRSAVKDDPSFKGVTVRFQTSFSNGHSRLHMSAFYRSCSQMSRSLSLIPTTGAYPTN